MARSQPSPFNTFRGAAAPLGNWTNRGGSFAAQGALVSRFPMRKDCGLRLPSWSNRFRFRRHDGAELV